MTNSTNTLRENIVGALPQLRRFARSLVGSAADADDLMQSTVERALSKPNAFQNVDDNRAYLFRICRNIRNDELRKLRVRRAYALEASYEADTAFIDGSPEAVIEMHRQQAMIAELSPESRAVLLLVGVEGYSYKEAAEILACPVGTVMSRLARARAKLADAIQASEVQE